MPLRLPTPADRYNTIGNDDWIGEEIHYDWQINKSIHLLAGADGRQSLFAHQHDFDAVHGDVLNIDSSINYWGIFAEGEDKLNDWLSLTVGGRLDNTQRIGLSFSPRFAAIITPDQGRHDQSCSMAGRFARRTCTNCSIHPRAQMIRIPI